MSVSADELQFCFVVEWFDTQACVTRAYNLFYFAIDKTIEMVEIKSRRLFLKRCSYPAITLNDLYIGATVTVYARQLRVKSYGDDFTRERLTKTQGRTLCIVKPDAYEQTGKVLDTIVKNGFSVARLRMVRLSPQQAAQFYGDAQLTDRAAHLSSNSVTAVEVIGDGVVAAWKDIVGTVDGGNACLAGLFGSGGVRDAVHASASDAQAVNEIAFFFPSSVPGSQAGAVATTASSSFNPALAETAQFNNCSLCIIKPHAVRSGVTGEIVDAILAEGYEVSALQQLTFDATAAGEFLEVYNKVVPDYHAMVKQLSEGSCVAIEVRSEDVVASFRDFAGPMDPEIARHIKAATLRARFGNDKVCNGVHCTDLTEDGPLESEFCFKILQQ